jgi:hypothetical protein
VEVNAEAFVMLQAGINAQVKLTKRLKRNPSATLLHIPVAAGFCRDKITTHTGAAHKAQ